jgi:low affinity Fe/Cu permease
MNEIFRRFANFTSRIAGSPWAFVVAILLIVFWLVSGPFFGFSDTWQLVINTGTTIITFLMVFLIQNTQNRETRAVNVKLDELLRAVHEARTNLVSLEDASDDEIDALHKQFQEMRERLEIAVDKTEPTGTVEEN